MKFKVDFVRPGGKPVDSHAFRMLFPFPTRAEAEANAALWRNIYKGLDAVIVAVDEQGNIRPSH